MNFKILMVNEMHNQVNDNTLLYFGSHNFTPSAWGGLDGHKELQYISNWDIGVVFPPEEGSS